MKLLNIFIISLLSISNAAADSTYDPSLGIRGKVRNKECIQVYEPVCGYRDTGLRCIKAPCDTWEWVEYSNSCTACSDNKVHGYLPNQCE